MKGVLLVATMALCASVSAFGQGSVVFSNAGGQPVLCADGTRVPIGSTYQLELMYAPDGTPAAEFDSMATRVGRTAVFGPVPGYFSGGVRTVISITPAGGFGLFQVRAWATAYGTSYNDVVASGTGAAGKSNIIRVDTGGPPPDTASGLVHYGLMGFYVEELSPTPCIPEPSPSALAMVACGVLLVIRRRKSQPTR